MTDTSEITSRSSAVMRKDLCEGWTVRAASGPVPAAISDQTLAAVVPGVVHMDLLRAELIPDPYLDNNEALLAWIGLVDWTYEMTFEVTEDELTGEKRHELVFDGLDTVASVTLNGQVVADVANQHRTYRFEVGAILCAGQNRVTVAFRSPLRYANEQSVALGVRPRPYPLPFEAIRKSACNFGWDWGIATFTSGIWRPVALESWSMARMSQVRIEAQPNGTGGRATATVLLDRASDEELELTLEIGGIATSIVVDGGVTEAVVAVQLDSVETWWPVGYGEQPLYDAAVTLLHAGEAIDSTRRRVGFRTVKWDTTPDSEGGTPFQLIVNGQPVFVKGVNWIPDDALFPRVDRARYENRLRQAKDANLNLIRVWGGGIYESDDFYELCDELGLLTWQDFLFACSAYAEEEPLRSEVEAEVRDNIARLSHHASLVLFTGNNENLWGFEDWGWKERLDGKTWGAYYYYDLFPRLVAELASHIAYAPGSPFSPHGQHPNDENHGSMHLWEQWNRLDWSTYRDHVPRFVAEFGWQGPPAWSTLIDAIHDEPITPESPGMIVHQKAGDGNVKLAVGLQKHYRVPEDMETWHWAMQLNQANAISCALDWFRSHAPFTSGAIVWQLNDCWPVTSWAAIDGYGVEKPLFFALKNSFAPRVVTIQPRDGRLAVTVGNDSGVAWEGPLVVSRLTFAGEVLDAVTIPVALDARTAQTVDVAEHVSATEAVESELLCAELNGVRGLWFFAEPRDSALKSSEIAFTVAKNGEGFAVTATARTLVRDLTLLVDKLDALASVDHGLVTLLPGESFTFQVVGLNRLDAEMVAAAGIARSGNQLI